MKAVLTRFFWPILSFFERGEEPENYRPSHRRILLAVGFLFLVLSGVSLFFALVAQVLGALIPILFFFAISLVCTVVAGLGSDRAVARIWGVK